MPDSYERWTANWPHSIVGEVITCAGDSLSARDQLGHLDIEVLCTELDLSYNPLMSGARWGALLVPAALSCGEAEPDLALVARDAGVRPIKW
jgi:hypothetical protein